MSGTFLQAATILLREGLEALLVIAALAAYLSKAGAHHRLKALYVGAGVAIVASLAMAWVFQTYYGGSHNDLLEGVVIAVAAVIMLYVAAWLFVRRDARVWQSTIKAQADEALARDTGWAVGLLAFLAVFREGAETVLFVYALAQTEGGYTMPLIGGLLAAAVVLGVLFFVIERVAKVLPLRTVFTVTSILLFVMAIKFIGEAMQEFQEQQYVSYSDIPGGNWLMDIGFNPTWEAVITQVVVTLAMVAVVLVIGRRERSRLSASA